jgi:hypothetical protein
MSCVNKVVVFDLDETLGYFSEFGMLWDSIMEFIKIYHIQHTNERQLFNKTLDLYPEFLRPHIFTILDYLKDKKLKSFCNKVIIYTNNQGPRKWALQIRQYFEDKLNYPLFDQIIAAFKINGKLIEPSRTSHDKTHRDLLKCSKIPETSHICFLDDVFHLGMHHPNIHYIHLTPYKHDITFQQMIQRFVKMNPLLLSPIQLNFLNTYLWSMLKKYKFNYVEKTHQMQKKDEEISLDILNHFRFFFAETSSNTVNKKSFINHKKIPTDTYNICITNKQHVSHLSPIVSSHKTKLNKTHKKKWNKVKNRKKTRKLLVFNS